MKRCKGECLNGGRQSLCDECQRLDAAILIFGLCVLMAMFVAAVLIAAVLA